MRRTWWEYGISAAVLLLVSMSINCELIAGLQERFPPVDDPGGSRECLHLRMFIEGVWGGSCLTS